MEEKKEMNSLKDMINIKFDTFGEKVAFLYDYENFQWIVMIASFVLGLIMILFSKLEEKKL